MKIIYPHKISSEILDVIYEAKEHLIIVSPYVDFWTRISNDLKAAIQRGVKVDFYTRHDSNNSTSWEQIENLGIKPKLIPNLHAKLYFNEKSGVISSMNLLFSSNNSSIEIGCKVESNEELMELNHFVQQFLIPFEIQEKPNEEDIYLDKAKFSEVLANYTNTKVYWKSDKYYIHTRNSTYYLEIDKVQKKFCIITILSRKQAENYNSKFSEFNKSTNFLHELIIGQDNNYDLIVSSFKKRLSNSFLDKIQVNEKKMVIHEISILLENMSNFKDANS